MNKILETKHLILREFTVEDDEFLLTLMCSPSWLQFIGNKSVKNTDHARQYIEKGLIQSYREKGFGLWLVEKKELNIPIGMCGLLKRETLENVDIGFALLPEYEGKGYGLEIAASTLIYGKHILDIKTIVAITRSDNKRSIALLEKLGMRYHTFIRLKPESEELMLFI